MPRKKKPCIGKVTTSAKRAKLLRLNETSEQRESRLSCQRMRMVQSRESETPEQRQQRLEKQKQQMRRARSRKSQKHEGQMKHDALGILSCENVQDLENLSGSQQSGGSSISISRVTESSSSEVFETNQLPAKKLCTSASMYSSDNFMKEHCIPTDMLAFCNPLLDAIQVKNEPELILPDNPEETQLQADASNDQTFQELVKMAPQNDTLSSPIDQTVQDLGSQSDSFQTLHLKNEEAANSSFQLPQVREGENNLTEAQLNLTGSSSNNFSFPELVEDDSSVDLLQSKEGESNEVGAHLSLTTSSSKHLSFPQLIEDESPDLSSQRDVLEDTNASNHHQSFYFPRYVKNLMTVIVCGIPFCNGKLENIRSYVNHLRNVHKASNFACPFCPEMCNLWSEFKTHLLCHGPKLYACGTNECEFYHWNKQAVRSHKRDYENDYYPELTIRDFFVSSAAGKLNVLHLDKKFSESETNFICLFCNYKSWDYKVMKNHIYRELAYYRFLCSRCQKRFVSRKEIQDHYMIWHSESDIHCSEQHNSEVENGVKFVLTHQQEFFQDMSMEDSCETKQRRSCEKCNKIFNNPLQLGFHLHTCLQKKYCPYECRFCKNRFVNLLALRYHADKEHHLKNIKYSLITSHSVEDEIKKALSEVRLKQMQDLFKQKSLQVSADKLCEMKFYKCNCCVFKAPHKYNLLRHMEKNHIVNKVTISNNGVNDSNSDTDSQMKKNGVSKCLIKRYSCDYWAAKMQEVEQDLKRAHTLKSPKCFYYFTADANTYFSASGEFYSCAFCKTQTFSTLFALKKHADSEHKKQAFEVKCFVPRTPQESSHLACAHCYMIVENRKELQGHVKSCYPSLPSKSFGNFRIGVYFRNLDNILVRKQQTARLQQIVKQQQQQSNQQQLQTKKQTAEKQAKVFKCSNCESTFFSLEKMKKHFEEVHKIQMNITLDFSQNASLKLYKCAFCEFGGDRNLLEIHLATQHNIFVICCYCNQQFKVLSELKDHHSLSHASQPIKFKRRTDKGEILSSCILTLKTTDQSCDVAHSDGAVSEVKLEPIDFNSLTVHTSAENGNSTALPFADFIQLHNIFPKVVLRDVSRKKDGF